MQLGRLLVVAGAGLVVAGLLTIAAAKMHLPLGRLPGDIVWRGKNGSFYFPWVTCLVLSILGSLLLWLFNRR